jgi:IMP dehydrogenase/GMP reductase
MNSPYPYLLKTYAVARFIASLISCFPTSVNTEQEQASAKQNHKREKTSRYYHLRGHSGTCMSSKNKRQTQNGRLSPILVSKRRGDKKWTFQR